MTVRAATSKDVATWATMRAELWRDGSVEEHLDEVIASLAADPSNSAAFVRLDDDGNAIGFAEATLRHDYVNGCDTSPVAFLEGIYVSPQHQGAGAGRELALAVQSWARERGCT